jgi:hypothetical protein
MRNGTISSWETPATQYPRKRLGFASIANSRYDRGTYEAYGTHPPGCEPYRFYTATRPFNVTCLKIGSKTWMVDDPPHFWAMQEHATFYTGRVLVAGLGLGLILHALQDNKAVTKITVVEREKDVIRLVKPLVPKDSRIDIVHADWYKFTPDEQPDGVFYDLFVGDADNGLLAMAIREIIELKRRFPTAGVFRIHGFNSDKLNEIGDQVIAGEKAMTPNSANVVMN